MKIDPKYFNLFAVIVAVFAMIAIAYFTVSYAGNQRVEFESALGSGADLYNTWFVRVDGTDSLRAVQFRDRVVVIDFWSTWSEPSLKSQDKLREIISAYPDSLRPVVIAAAVRDADETVQGYVTGTGADFIYVRGTEVFQKMKVPGVPTQVVFGPNGKLIESRVGFRQPDEFDRLDSLLHSQLKVNEP